MTKRCIKGVICVENITLILVIILALLVFLFYKTGANQPSLGASSGAGTDAAFVQSLHLQPIATPRPNTFFTNDSSDVLTNPYTPPLKDNAMISSIVGGGGGGGGIPINVATSSAINTSYRQIGLLTKASPSGSTSNSDPVIMPLMGAGVRVGESSINCNRAPHPPGCHLPGGGRNSSGRTGKRYGRGEKTF